MSEHEKVMRFYEAMDIPVAERPTMPDEATRMLRCRLLLEETLEYIKASGCRVHVAGRDSSWWPTFFAVRATHEPSLAAMGQENEDVIYVAMGNRCAMGTDVRVFDEVHRANMAKLGRDGCVQRDERGKILKPDGWTPPDVARVLREMEDEA